MTQGLSLHIGLNRVDPAGYNGWDGQLAGCINDATAMQGIANRCGYHATLLTNEQATAANVIAAIGQAATTLTAQDIFFISYSGHGGQIPDVNGDEEDGLDETWVLYDRMLIDDELYQLWSQFEAGVRIFMLSDSCHSGTMAKVLYYNQLPPAMPSPAPSSKGMGPGRIMTPTAYRAIPQDVQRAAYIQHQAIYDSLQWLATKGDRATVDASVILISGCQDNQLSGDGDQNGIFTGTLLQVWNNGAYQGSYYKFWKDIAALMPATQSPNYYTVGADNTDFANATPFVINGQATQPSSGGAPSIQGPATLAANDAPPTFQINAGPGRYYVVEITSQPALFDYNANGSQRNANNFYGSWSDHPHFTAPSYTLPADIWNLLKNNSQLYYRIGTTTSATGWNNYQVSTADADGIHAPSIQITGAMQPQPTGGSVPSIQGPANWSATEGAPTFQVNAGPGRYYIVELTTQAELFDITNYGNDRTADNFYGSWRDSPHFAAASYTPADDVWHRLAANGDTVYYRIGTTSSATGWDDYQVSTGDQEGANAPHIEVVGNHRQIQRTGTQPTHVAHAPGMTGVGVAPLGR
ncbi:MAG: caspase family protein [Caldilineaceae bacterium]